MQVRKYEAKTMQEALGLVKQELGPEAIILHAKDNVSSFGLGGQSSVEVTAAVSEETLRRKNVAEKKLNDQAKVKFRESSATSQKKFINSVFDRREETDQRKAFSQIPYVDIEDDETSAKKRGTHPDINGRNVQEAISIAQPPEATTKLDRVLDYNQIRQQRREDIERRGAPAPKKPSPAQPAVTAEDVRPFVQTKTAQKEMPRIALEEQDKPNDSSNKYQHEVVALRTQIEQLQKIIADFQKVPQNFITQHPGAHNGISFELSPMFEKLTSAGVSTDNTVEILKLAQKEIPENQLKKQAFIDGWVARFILKTTRTIEGIGQKKYQVFVGPSGQGKTASLVKLASLVSLKMRKKIAILSTDTSRVGVAEQLRIFAQILNVPFAVIQRPEDWAVVEDKLGSVDHVFVDTPGFQLKSPEEMAIMSQMLPPVEKGRSIHYVQSALAKDESAFEIASRYKRFAFDDVIFTNIDESHQHGIVYNFQKKYEVPLHSFGIGSRIPEDIELATKERVVDLIFKLTKMRKD